MWRESIDIIFIHESETINVASGLFCNNIKFIRIGSVMVQGQPLSRMLNFVLHVTKWSKEASFWINPHKH